jgi:hypothetical protein
MTTAIAATSWKKIFLLDMTCEVQVTWDVVRGACYLHVKLQLYDRSVSGHEALNGHLRSRAMRATFEHVLVYHRT